MEERVSGALSGNDSCCSSSRGADSVVKVAWVEGGRALGFGRIADGGIATVRVEAAATEERRKAERERVENIVGRCMASPRKQNLVGVYNLDYALEMIWSLSQPATSIAVAIAVVLSFFLSFYACRREIFTETERDQQRNINHVISTRACLGVGINKGVSGASGVGAFLRTTQRRKSS